MVWVLKKMKSGHFTGCRKPLSKTMQMHRLFWEIFILRESEQKKMSVKLLNGLKSGGTRKGGSTILLGCSYFAGIGVEEDKSKAMEWLEKAAEQGNADAQNKLGEYYIGVGVETRKAFELFQKAAENGSKEAQRNLGKCYMKGLGVNKLPAEAVKYYKKAAEQGDAEAQYLFATCLFIGNAVTQNVKQAVEYYQKSAQQEYMKAINDLGVCYARGIGVPKDGKEALAHFGAASEGDHGFYVADSNVAYCYQNGIGVEKDKHRADVLYIVAEAKEDASRMSKAIKQMSRDVFAGKQTKTTMDEILKMNKSFERSKEKASNRKRLRMALEMDF